MGRPRVIVLLLALLCSFSYGQSAKSAQRSSARTTANLSPSDLYSKSVRATVTVIALDAEDRVVSQASGFFVAPDQVVTNLHALKWASTIVVKRYGTDIRALVRSVLGIDLEHDLCLLLVTPERVHYLNVARMPVKVGDTVYVIGNPKGLEATFSNGMISAIRSDSEFQIDAPISHGSSGGPVLNRAGEVVGVASSSLVSGQNLNFAVPASLVSKIPLNGPFTVDTAGAAAISDREYKHFFGPVRSCKETVREVQFSRDADALGPERVTSVSFDPEGRDLDKPAHAQTETAETRAVPDVAWDDQPNQRKSPKKALQVPLGFELDVSTESPGGTSSAEVYAVAASHPYSTRNELRGFKIKLNGFGNDVEWGSGKQRWVATYDDSQREVETRAYYDIYLDFTIKYTYKVDGQGNWTRKEECILQEGFLQFGCQLTSVSTRELTYYEER